MEDPMKGLGKMPKVQGNFNEQDIRHVLWYYGSSQGFEPGGFTKSLLSAFSHADRENTHKLREAFPGLGVCFALVKDTVDGKELLERLLKMKEGDLLVHDADDQMINNLEGGSDK